jgi:hypothetical protein
MPPNDHRSGSEALQSQHRAKALLDSTMVLFDQIVQVFTAAEQHPLRQFPILF